MDGSADRRDGETHCTLDRYSNRVVQITSSEVAGGGCNEIGIRKLRENSCPFTTDRKACTSIKKLNSSVAA